MTVAFTTTATRTGGDTPLSVHFDATACTSTLTTRPTLDCIYIWDFYRDGEWVESKLGHNVGYIFDTTDVWEAKLTIFEPNLTFTTQEVGILIQPTEFSGTTFVVAADGDFTGAPPGTPIHESNFKTILDTYGRLNVRFLFKRGNTFTAPSETRYDDFDHCRIGAWGPGVGLNAEYGFYANDPVFSQAAGNWPSGQWTMLIIAIQDIAIEHINFVAVETTTQQAWYLLGSSLDYNLRDATIWKCQFSNPYGEGWFGINPNFSYQLLDNMPYRIAVHDCYFQSCTGIGGFLGGRFLSFYHNYLKDSDGSHLLRSDFAWKADISMNRFYNPATQRHAYKLHAPSNRSYTDSYGAIEWTDYVHISRNYVELDAVDNTAFDVAPQDSGADEWLRNIVVDANHIKFLVYGISSAINWCQADGMTIRNNILEDRFWTGEGSSGVKLVYINRRMPTGQIPRRFRIYNNLVWSNSTTRGTITVVTYQTGQDFSDVVAAGNILRSARNNDRTRIIHREDWQPVVNATIVANMRLHSESNPVPNFDWADEVNGDFRIGANSDAIGQGHATYHPILDADLGVRAATHAAGPFGYGLTAYTPSGGSNPSQPEDPPAGGPPVGVRIRNALIAGGRMTRHGSRAR